MVDSRSPRFEPSPTYARGTAASLLLPSLPSYPGPTRGSPFSRRLRARSVHLRHRDRGHRAQRNRPARATGMVARARRRRPCRRAAGPGVPITIVDSGTGSDAPGLRRTPEHDVLERADDNGLEEYHGTIVASIAAAPENGADIVGVYPTAALQIFDASPDRRKSHDFRSDHGHPPMASAHCPGVINLSFGGMIAGPATAPRDPDGGAQRLPRRRRSGATSAKRAAQPTFPRLAGRTSSPSRQPTRTTRSRRSRPPLPPTTSPRRGTT